MTPNERTHSERPSDAVIEAARDLAKRLPSGQAESVYHACIELRRLRKALAELDRQRAETCTARDDTPSKSRTKRIAIQRAALESFAGVPAAQPADEIADLTKRLAAAQRPFDPDVAEVIRKGWDTLFDDEQPAPDAAREPADAQLADTQRAIIEAAEARGYARAKAEGEADARDAVRLAFCIELGTLPKEYLDQPKGRRWSLTLHPNGWQVLVVHGSTYVECIDAAIEAAKPQRAAQQRKGG